MAGYKIFHKQVRKWFHLGVTTLCYKFNVTNLFGRSTSYNYDRTSLTVDSSIYQQIGQSSNAVSIDMDLLQVGSEPVGVRCPYCQEDVMTRATYRNTTVTHIVALLMGVFFWWLCCCIIPYVTKRWKNVDHNCPNCRRHLGVYTRTTIL